MSRETFDVFRDGMVHVMEKKCVTCIFNPGNVMNLRPGRVREMVEDAVRDDHLIYCHKTLDGEAACCRGFFDSHKTSALQIAERLERISWQKEENGDDHQG